ncbi:hypothetical protein D3C78_872330 [compost metagenome]
MTVAQAVEIDRRLGHGRREINAALAMDHRSLAKAQLQAVVGTTLHIQRQGQRLLSADRCHPGKITQAHGHHLVRSLPGGDRHRATQHFHLSGGGQQGATGHLVVAQNRFTGVETTGVTHAIETAVVFLYQWVQGRRNALGGDKTGGQGRDLGAQVQPEKLPGERIGGQANAPNPTVALQTLPVHVQALDPQRQQFVEFALGEPVIDGPEQVLIVL